MQWFGELQNLFQPQLEGAFQDGTSHCSHLHNLHVMVCVTWVSVCFSRPTHCRVALWIMWAADFGEAEKCVVCKWHDGISGSTVSVLILVVFCLFSCLCAADSCGWWRCCVFWLSLCPILVNRISQERLEGISLRFGTWVEFNSRID